MTKPRILSGVQPTGNLHLGNYLGAIRNWVGLQDSHECLFMLADLHAITVPQDPAELTKNTRETAAAYIACGIDPKKSAIFPQSNVSMHAELAWILNNHVHLGALYRMTQFKDKTQQSRVFLEELYSAVERLIKNTSSHTGLVQAIAPNKSFTLDDLIFDLPIGAGSLKDILQRIMADTTSLESSTNLVKFNGETSSKAPLGLFAYPVLMAADIIGYHATHVPVGADQKQHLELARDIAGAFNRAYGEDFFPLPEPLILGAATRVMSLTDGTKKMSKSDPSDYSRITLTDDADTIANKIKKAQTDSEPSLTYDETNRPSVANLLTLYAALSDSTPQQVAAQFATLKTGQFKAQLAELAVEKLAPITTRMRELMRDTTTLDAILKEGTEKARAIALPILAETKKRVGLLSV